MRYRFSGHESFPLRYSWLTKAVRAIRNDAHAFADEELSMVNLGLGKNMVRALRFWMQATGVIETNQNGAYEVTPFGNALLGEAGYDQFLEDIRTIWLLHWKVTTLTQSPLFAWDFLFHRWTQSEFSRTEANLAFRLEADKQERPPSEVTLGIHFDVFLHSYVPVRGGKEEAQEDNLDSPFVELDLLQKVGERKVDGSKREPVYAFRRETKSDITPDLFLYCLDDFRRRRHASEMTLSSRDIALAPGSPGMVFKLPEWDVRERLARIDSYSHGVYNYLDSAVNPSVYYVGGNQNEIDLLPFVYLDATQQIGAVTLAMGENNAI